MTPTKNTIFSLNTIYILLLIILLILLIIEKNMIDLLYIGLITIYFIRIKKHRSSR